MENALQLFSQEPSGQPLREVDPPDGDSGEEGALSSA